jgi:hypothetical protein
VGGCVRRFQPFFVSARVSRFPSRASRWRGSRKKRLVQRYLLSPAAAFLSTARFGMVYQQVPHHPRSHSKKAANPDGFSCVSNGRCRISIFRAWDSLPSWSRWPRSSACGGASSTLPIVRTLQSWFRTSTTCLIDLLHIHRIGELTCEIALILSNHPDVASFASFTASRSTRFQSAPVRRRKPKRSR